MFTAVQGDGVKEEKFIRQASKFGMSQKYERFGVRCLQCFDTAGWASGRASGL